MNKQEAYQAMCQGHKVCNEYYTPDEYAFINQNGLIEYEDGCVVGDQFSENWRVYQDPENKFEWSIWEDTKPLINSDKTGAELLLEANEEYVKAIDNHIYSIEPYIFNNLNRTIYETTTYFPKAFVPKNSHKRTNKRK